MKLFAFACCRSQRIWFVRSLTFKCKHPLIIERKPLILQTALRRKAKANKCWLGSKSH